MATAIPIPEKYDVDAVIERLAALPNPERRRAFFAELETLPAFSRDRIELAEYGRRRLAPGPYRPAEYATLIGMYEPTRTLTPDQAARQREHEAAQASVGIAKELWRQARLDLERAESEWSPFGSDVYNSARDAAKREAARQRRNDAQVALAARFEEFEDANALEVRARMHQTRPLPSRDRSFLARLIARVTPQ